MHKPAINRGWLRSLIYFFAIIITFLLFDSLGYIIINAFSEITLKGPISYRRENIYLLVIYQLFILTGITLLTLFFRKHIDNKSIKSLGFLNYRFRNDIFLGLLLGFILIGTGFLTLYILSYLSIGEILTNSQYLSGSLILCLLISWIEELSFRGYILNNLAESFHPYIALLISSLSFAALHIFNSGLSILAFTNLFLAGILLGIVFIYTKTIWFALSLHFSWNFFQGPVFGFKVSGIEMDSLVIQSLEGTDFITGGEFGFEGSLLCSLLIIISIIALDRYYNKSLNMPLVMNN